MNTLNVWLIRINMLVWAVVIVMSLKGCTKLSQQDTHIDEWSIEIVSNETECIMTIKQGISDIAAGDSITIDQAK